MALDTLHLTPTHCHVDVSLYIFSIFIFFYIYFKVFLYFQLSAELRFLDDRDFPHGFISGLRGQYFMSKKVCKNKPTIQKACFCGPL